MDPVLLIVTLLVDFFLRIHFWCYWSLLFSDVDDDAEIVVVEALFLFCDGLLLLL